MPGKELSDPIKTHDTPPFALLKSHKTLPRRHAPLEQPITFSKSAQLQRHETEQESLTKSAEIESWIPEPDVIHLTLSHSLPLTPPGNSPENEGTSWIDGPLPDDNKVTTRSVSSGINTPLIARSPPTPETTPPRIIQQRPQQQQQQSAPAYQRVQSNGTRSDSFRTAREDASSDDESHQSASPSMQPARQKWLRQTAHSKLGSIGLGLGLELDGDGSTQPAVTPKNAPSNNTFGAFDGAWGSSKDDVAAVSPANGAASDPDAANKKGTSKKPQNSTHSPEKFTQSAEDAAWSIKSLSLRQRLKKNHESPASVSTEKFAEEINWPSRKHENDYIEAKMRDVDSHRLSQMSGTSTVEAVVIATPPPKRRQTLRHTGKIVTVDAPGNEPRRASVVYKHAQPQRRRLRHTGSPEQVKRGSIASDVSFEMLSGHPTQDRKRQNSLPVIVIPERKSSLVKSAPPSLRRLSRTLSLTSRQRSSRPITAPTETIGYFDLPCRERRIVSAVPPTTVQSKPKEKTLKETSPAIVSESLAMSANTVRKVSRANSTNSTHGRLFNGTQENAFHLQTGLSGEEPQEMLIQNIQGANFDRATIADWSALRPRSTQVTPFSLRSAHSSTPGTLEVNEATAISIYPHTNKSILVVQQLAHPDFESSEHSAIVASNASFAIPGPHAPAFIHQARARRLVGSPLKNPREPPQPPDFKVIPPTPVPNHTSTTSSSERTSRHTPASNSAFNRLSNSRPITMVRRALSARRYSETFISPLTRGLSQRTTTIIRRPASLTSPDPDNKLHPFWRPRGFWDDVNDSDSDSEFGNSGLLVGNSLGMPSSHGMTTKITAQRQPPRRSASLTQRLSNSMRFPRVNSFRRTNSMSGVGRIYQRTTMHSDHDEAHRSYEFIPQPDGHDHGKSGGGMPRLGYQVHFVGLKGLAERMEKRKERRIEERREKLRGSIGLVVPGNVKGWGGAGYGRGL